MKCVWCNSTNIVECFELPVCFDCYFVNVRDTKKLHYAINHIIQELKPIDEFYNDEFGILEAKKRNGFSEAEQGRYTIFKKYLNAKTVYTGITRHSLWRNDMTDQDGYRVYSDFLISAYNYKNLYNKDVAK